MSIEHSSLDDSPIEHSAVGNIPFNEPVLEDSAFDDSTFEAAASVFLDGVSEEFAPLPERAPASDTSPPIPLPSIPPTSVPTTAPSPSTVSPAIIEPDIVDPVSPPPFVIELRQEEKASNGHFRPAAFLKLRTEFRTSGLLFSLSPEDLKSLLFLLTFVSPNGSCQASLHHLASAMRVSAFKAQKRMQRLTACTWNEHPLVVELRQESGLISYVPHPHLVDYQHIAETTEEVVPSGRGGSREAVIAHSRQHYARTRQEVEQEIAQRMGWLKDTNTRDTDIKAEESPFTPVKSDLQKRLERTGLTAEQALYLINSFDSVRIERQLQWLPYRRAKNPAGLLLAAIEDNYEAPPALRHSRPRPEVSRPEVPGPDFIQPEATD